MSRHGPASCCHCFECSWQRLWNCGNSRRGRDISCCFSTSVFTTLRARVVNVNGPYGPEVGNDSPPFRKEREKGRAPGSGQALRGVILFHSYPALTCRDKILRPSGAGVGTLFVPFANPRG